MEYAVAAQFVVVPRITAARSRVSYATARLEVQAAETAARLCDHAPGGHLIITPRAEGVPHRSLAAPRPGHPSHSGHRGGGR